MTCANALRSCTRQADFSFAFDVRMAIDATFGTSKCNSMDTLVAFCAPLLRVVGDDPERTKELLRHGYGRLLDLEFDTILVGHGAPVVGGGKEALKKFVEG